LRQADPAEFGQRHYSIVMLSQAQLAELIDIRGPQVPGIGDPLGNEPHRVFFIPAQGDNHGPFHLKHSWINRTQQRDRQRNVPGGQPEVNGIR
jgi:hypothetical protein